MVGQSKMQFDQNIWLVDHLECRSAKHFADGNKPQQWPQALAGDVWGCLTRHSLPLQGKTQVFGAKPDTKQSSSEILRQGA